MWVLMLLASPLQFTRSNPRAQRFPGFETGIGAIELKSYLFGEAQHFQSLDSLILILSISKPASTMLG